MSRIIFVSCHHDLTRAEFNTHYRLHLDALNDQQCKFLISDDMHPGVIMIRNHLKNIQANYVVYGLCNTTPWSSPLRSEAISNVAENNNVIVSPVIHYIEGFSTTDLRDSAMTLASDMDLLWQRPFNKHHVQVNLLHEMARLLVLCFNILFKLETSETTYMHINVVHDNNCRRNVKNSWWT